MSNYILASLFIYLWWCTPLSTGPFILSAKDGKTFLPYLKSSLCKWKWVSSWISRTSIANVLCITCSEEFYYKQLFCLVWLYWKLKKSFPPKVFGQFSNNFVEVFLGRPSIRFLQARLIGWRTWTPGGGAILPYMAV